MIASSFLISNNAVAGAGGQGGGGAQFGEVESGDDTRGGNGGNGGRAEGGGVFASSPTPALFTLFESLISRNTLVGGDGGVGGIGGIGEVGPSEATAELTILDGGDGGTGGNGGAAFGGGVRTDGLFAAIDDTTINENIVSSGFGGRGGHGGSGGLFVDSTPNDENVAEGSGNGGDGGNGGTAAGGGISIGQGSVGITTSTIARNAVVSGGGGDGGVGTAALARTGDSGDGGDGGDAFGGGVANASGELEVTASTIVENVVNAAGGGFAGQLGQIVASDQEALDEQSRLEAPARTSDGLTFANSSLAIFTAAGESIDPFFNASLAAAPTSDGLSFVAGDMIGPFFEDLGVDVGVGLAFPVAIGAAGAAVAAPVLIPGAISTITTGAAIGSNIAVASTSFAAVGFATSVAGVGAGAAVLAIGVAVGVRIAINLSDGDNFGEAVGSALGDGPDIDGVNFGILFTNPQTAPEPEDGLIPFGPGAEGQAGAGGEAAGAGIFGDVTIGRTIVAQNQNRTRSFSRTETREDQFFDEDAGVFLPFLDDQVVIFNESRSAVVNVVTQTLTDASPNEVAGGTITSLGDNLIGIANTGFDGELTGTSANPLDPRLQPIFLLNGGTIQTLALLGDSPARGASTNVALAPVSQNGFEFGDVADIGAFGGISEQELTGDFNQDAFVNAADFTIFRDTLSNQPLTPFSGADANGTGTVDPTDFDLFTANFGATLTSTATAAIAVEPTLLATDIEPELIAREVALTDADPTAIFVDTPVNTPPRAGAISAPTSEAFADDELLVLALTQSPTADDDGLDTPVLDEAFADEEEDEGSDPSLEALHALALAAF